MRSRSALVLLLILGTAAACRRRPFAPAAPPPPARPVHGEVGFTFLPAPSGSAADAVEDHNRAFVPPVPRVEMRLPDYPPAALAAGAPPFTVALRITIDAEDGRVVRVEPSPAAPTSTGSFEREFRVAAERAVRLWRFSPGAFDLLEDGPDLDGDGAPESRKIVERVPVAVLYDVRFDFEIVDGEARVTSTADP